MFTSSVRNSQQQFILKQHKMKNIYLLKLLEFFFEIFFTMVNICTYWFRTCTKCQLFKNYFTRFWSHL